MQPAVASTRPLPEGVLIRRASSADAAGIASANETPDVFGGLLQMPYPNAESWRARLAESEKLESQSLVLVAVRGAEVLAHAGLYPVHASPRRKHAAGLGIAVAGACQGQGVGGALMAALCEVADGWAQWWRIELTVFADNARAIRLYERFGFEHEGRLRAYAMRNGHYEDVLTMARLHPRLRLGPQP